jgi:membrane-bound inhibitor of C-type lysozyme
MNRNKITILVLSVAGIVSGLPIAVAQTTFQVYRCVDGTNFIVGFYPHDPDAYLQIDGKPVVLRRRLAISGERYSGSGVTLKFLKAGSITVKHAGRKVTACEVI